MAGLNPHACPGVPPTLILASVLAGSVVLAGHSLAAASRAESIWRAARRVAKPCGGLRRPPTTFRHVIWIVMENQSYSDVIGSSDAPYLNSLAHKCGLAANFSAESHPSLPNYVAMTSGSTQGIEDDGDPSRASSRGTEHLLAARQAAGGPSTSRCRPPATSTTPHSYAVRHNPAVYYTNDPRSVPRTKTPRSGRGRTFRRDSRSSRRTSATTCTTARPATATAGSPASCRRSSQPRVPEAVDGRLHHLGRGLGRATTSPTLVLSRYTRPHTVSSKPFNHYSLLRTTEALLGIPAKLGQAAAAADMRASFHLR